MDQTGTTTTGNDDEDQALDGIAVSPPVPNAEDAADGEASALPEVRPALDAQDHEALQEDPSDPDAKLDIGLDETFPSSDAPANTRPGSGEPAPSSGYDEEAEAAIARDAG